jgi:hypothetical protein
MTYDEYNDRAEHECPIPLERSADEFDVGGMFWSPAARWERIVDTGDQGRYSFRITVTTDKTVWTFTAGQKLPYLPQWRASERRYVVIHEHSSSIDLSVGAEREWPGHTLASAHQVRGEGWLVTDRPAGGGDLEMVTVASKAKARTELNRRARAHAQRLGLRVYRPEASTPAARQAA